MPILNKEIEMIVHVDKEGKMRPIKFRLTDEEGVEQVFKIKRLISQDNERVFNGWSIKFVYEVVINDTIKICEIRFFKETMMWRLEKI